jgi:hypothetical protein
MTLFAPFVIETHKLSKTYKNVEELKPLNLNECQKEFYIEIIIRQLISNSVASTN